MPEENKTFKCISPQDMEAGLKDSTFWFVVNKIENDGQIEDQIVAVKDMDDVGSVVYLFQAEEDAETWKYIGNRMPAYQNGANLVVEGEIFQTLFKESLKHEEYKICPVSRDQAQILFSHEDYRMILLTRPELEGGADFREDTFRNNFRDSISDFREEILNDNVRDDIDEAR